MCGYYYTMQLALVGQSNYAGLVLETNPKRSNTVLRVHHTQIQSSHLGLSICRAAKRASCQAGV